MTVKIYTCFMLSLLITGCSTTLGLSLDERYQAAYDDVVNDPSEGNMALYMKLSGDVAKRDMKKANAEAEAATRESDKGFTEYFKQYGSDSFKRNNP